MASYPRWIAEYTDSFYNAFSNMLPASWGPVDMFTVGGILDGIFIEWVHGAVGKLKGERPLEEVARTFSTPSTLRAVLLYVFVAYQFTDDKAAVRVKAKETIDYLVEVLYALTKRDAWAKESNIIHSDDEIQTIIAKTPWRDGTPTSARELGKLYTSLASLVFGLYRDFFPQEANEAYGPYDASSRFGTNTVLAIKHFTKIRPRELWPLAERVPHEDIKIFQVYKGVSYRCEGAGFHTIIEGDVINGLVAYAVVADGKPLELNAIKALAGEYAELATEQSQVYKAMSKEELVAKGLEWLCYQLNGFFALAGMDWRPTPAMQSALSGHDIPTRFELDAYPPREVFESDPQFEVYWLKELYSATP